MTTPNPSPPVAHNPNWADSTWSTAGLMNTPAIPGSGQPTTTYNPATANANQAGVTPYSVSSPKMTVAGQLSDILSSGSPLLNQAQAYARDQMNARGLMNSSQAVTAGETGLINTALPIAQQDAQAHYGAMTNTANAGNQANQLNAQLGTQTSQFNAGQNNAAMSSAATASNSMTQSRMNNEAALQVQAMQNSGALANIQAQGSINVQLTDMQNKNKVLLQTSAGAAQYYNTMLQYMSAITTNPNMTHDQKANALNNSVTQLNDMLGTMTTISGIPGIQSLLNFSDSNLGGASPSTQTTPGGPQVPLNPTVNA